MCDKRFKFRKLVLGLGRKRRQPPGSFLRGGRTGVPLAQAELRSHVVTTVELIAHRLEHDIVAGAGASLGECRIMQRLCEVGRPLRVAVALFMNI